MSRVHHTDVHRGHHETLPLRGTGQLRLTCRCGASGAQLPGSQLRAERLADARSAPWGPQGRGEEQAQLDSSCPSGTRRGDMPGPFLRQALLPESLGRKGEETDSPQVLCFFITNLKSLSQKTSGVAKCGSPSLWVQEMAKPGGNISKGVFGSDTCA